jgi:hypothetical protein
VSALNLSELAMSGVAGAVDIDGLNLLTLPAWARDRLETRLKRLIRSTDRGIAPVRLAALIGDVSGLPPLARAVWRCYVDNPGTKDGRWRPSATEVGARIGWSERPVKYARADLIAWGWLVKVDDGRRHRGAWYVAVVPRELSAGQTPRRTVLDQARGARPARFRGADAAPLDGVRGADAAPLDGVRGADAAPLSKPEVVQPEPVEPEPTDPVHVTIQLGLPGVDDLAGNRAARRRAARTQAKQWRSRMVGR